MKIQVPINPLSNIDEYIKLGADEFYLGYINLKNPLLAHITSRRPTINSNFIDLKSLINVIEKIKKSKKEVYITLNEHFYPEIIKDYIYKDLESLLNTNIDGIIISDINILFDNKTLLDKIKIIASTGLNITNSSSVNFYKKLGFNRIILPRHLLIEEIKELTDRHQEMEFEIFIKNDDCPNIDGLCSYIHGIVDNQMFEQFCKKIIYNKSILKKHKFNDYACGACSLFELKNDNISSLKIVGRDKSNESIIKDVSFFKNILYALENYEKENDYKEFVRNNYYNVYKYNCENNCYYN